MLLLSTPSRPHIAEINNNEKIISQREKYEQIMFSYWRMEHADKRGLQKESRTQIITAYK